MTDTMAEEEEQRDQASGPAEDDEDPRQAQANKLFQAGVMLIYGRRKSVERAIKCVQRAIVLDDSNYKYWQLLGEAYYQRGSLNPAINCFMKSLDRAEQHLANCRQPDVGENAECKNEEWARVSADCLNSKLRMSDIRLSVMHLDDAMRGYSEIIASDPKNVAALAGLSKTRLQLARNCFSNNLVLSGHEHCMEALKFALRATCLCPHLCFSWKLAADCCLIQILFGQRGPFRTTIDVPEYPGANDEGLVIDQATCVELAQQFLCKALAVEPFKSSACLWHNLGVCLYLKFALLKAAAAAAAASDKQAAPGDADDSSLRMLLKKSLKCLFKALDYDRTNSQVRNSIALVALHLNLRNTAQSFLIKSIQTNRSTSEMQFSNLGYIYLQTGEFRLASVAFKRSQAEEPLYCRSWLGNALLSERSNSDTLTFLRHCHKLENNYESQLMYATRVASLPYAEDYNKDLINALDCMRRLINYDSASLESLNTLGLLLERCRFVGEARASFQKAHSMAPTDSRVVFNKLRQLETRGGGSREDELLLASAERLVNSSRDYALNMILYLFNSNQFRGVNSRVAKMIEKLPQDNVRDKIGAQILLALADRMEGRDFKSWLFKNIIDAEQTICVESLVNLFCLLLFGALTSDQDLIKQVGSDLTKYLIAYLSTSARHFADLFHSLEGFWARLLLFSSLFIDQANLIRPLVALFPMVPDLWLYLGLAQMFHKSTLAQAQYCIAKANLIGSTNANLTLVCDILLAILCTSSKKGGGSPKKNAQIDTTGRRQVHLAKAIHRCPNNQLLWDCLINPCALRTEEAENVELFQFAMDHVLSTMIS